MGKTEKQTPQTQIVINLNSEDPMVERMVRALEKIAYGVGKFDQMIHMGGVVDVRVVGPVDCGGT